MKIIGWVHGHHGKREGRSRAGSAATQDARSKSRKSTQGTGVGAVPIVSDLDEFHPERNVSSVSRKPIVSINGTDVGRLELAQQRRRRAA
jgi:hypothetical protein